MYSWWDSRCSSERVMIGKMMVWEECLSIWSCAFAGLSSNVNAASE